jgi:putative glutamine transport system substrate-binding protein
VFSRFTISSLSLGALLLGLVGLLSACSGGSPTGEGPSQADLLKTIESRGRLMAGVKYDSKPFGFLDTDGAVKGFDVDLIRELSKRLLGTKDAVEFQQVLSSTRVFAIQSGQLDVVAATMTITPEREELIDFTDPYYVAGQAILVPVRSPIHKLAELKGKRVLFVIGSTSEGNLKQKVPDAKLLGFKTATDAMAALKAGRGEAFTSDDTILSGMMSGSCDFRLLPERLSNEPYGLGLRQDAEHHSTDSLRQKINALLKEMKADGTLEKLKARWVVTGSQPAGCAGNS